MGVFEYVLSALGDQVCVYLRGAEALVDQESLHHTRIGTMIEHVRGKSVPQCMQADNAEHLQRPRCGEVPRCAAGVVHRDDSPVYSAFPAKDSRPHLRMPAGKAERWPEYPARRRGQEAKRERD